MGSVLPLTQRQWAWCRLLPLPPQHRPFLPPSFLLACPYSSSQNLATSLAWPPYPPLPLQVLCRFERMPSIPLEPPLPLGQLMAMALEVEEAKGGWQVRQELDGSAFKLRNEKQRPQGRGWLGALMTLHEMQEA